MSLAGTSLARRGMAMVFSVCLHVAALFALLHLIPAVSQPPHASGEKVLMARFLSATSANPLPAANPAQPALASPPTQTPPLAAAEAPRPKAAVPKPPLPQSPHLLAAVPQAQAAAAPVSASESAPASSAAAATRTAAAEVPGTSDSGPGPTTSNATAAASPAAQSAPAASAEPDSAAHPDYAYNPRPEYPSVARQFGLSGKVLVRVYVAMNGSPEQIVIAGPSGYDVLDQAALKSVKTWRFLPARRAGRAYASWVEFNVMFDLTN